MRAPQRRVRDEIELRAESTMRSVIELKLMALWMGIDADWAHAYMCESIYGGALIESARSAITKALRGTEIEIYFNSRC